jgi:hypothetical protein
VLAERLGRLTDDRPHLFDACTRFLTKPVFFSRKIDPIFARKYGFRARMRQAPSAGASWRLPAYRGLLIAYVGIELFLMANDNHERWMELCELAAKEQNPQKLTELVYEIHCLLRQKESQPRPVDKPRQAA